MKVLLNAESFGFGPSASIANIFNQIKDLDFITEIDYVGNGHSLDLQKKLPYNKIIEITNDIELIDIIKKYDVFLTALDFRKASIAKECGVKTIIYDTLLWYWRKKPEIIKKCDYYIAQDFYGVKENIKELNLINYSIVPPIVKEVVTKISEKYTVINFGGLENPLWDISVTVAYIDKILKDLLPLLKEENIKIICSKSHVSYFEKYGAENLSYKEMQNILSNTKYIIATPGLGNIYEIAQYKIPSLFLPPANDSQGQQLLILKEKNIILNYIDWLDLNCNIDYCEEQEEVLKNIKENIFKKHNIQKLFKEKLFKNENKSLDILISEFGLNGNKKLEEELKKILKGLK